MNDNYDDGKKHKKAGKKLTAFFPDVREHGLITIQEQNELHEE